MTIREMVIEYLNTHKFDGLFNEDDCACLLDDLMPCGEECSGDCEPGYKSPGDEEYDFYVTKEKP